MLYLFQLTQKLILQKITNANS